MFAPDRLNDWPEKLARTVARHRSCSFAWGAFDCATFFADAVRATTGASPFDGLDPWLSERAALRILSRTGAASVKAFLDERLPVVHPSQLRRGDAGYTALIIPLGCPAIVVGTEAVSRDATGWKVFPVSLLTTGYRIGS